MQARHEEPRIHRMILRAKTETQRNRWLHALDICHTRARDAKHKSSLVLSPHPSSESDFDITRVKLLNDGSRIIKMVCNEISDLELDCAFWASFVNSAIVHAGCDYFTDTSRSFTTVCTKVTSSSPKHLITSPRRQQQQQQQQQDPPVKTRRQRRKRHATLPRASHLNLMVISRCGMTLSENRKSGLGKEEQKFILDLWYRESIQDYREIKKRMVTKFGSRHVDKLKRLIQEECRQLSGSTAFRNTHIKVDLYYCNRRIATFMGMSPTSREEKWVENSWRFLCSDNQGRYHESTIPVCEIPLDTVMRISIVADNFVLRQHDFPLLHRRADTKDSKKFQEVFKKMLENVPKDAVTLRHHLLRNRDHAWRKGNHIFVMPSHGQDESFQVELGFKLPWETPVYVIYNVKCSRISFSLFLITPSPNDRYTTTIDSKEGNDENVPFTSLSIVSASAYAYRAQRGRTSTEELPVHIDGDEIRNSNAPRRATVRQKPRRIATKAAKFLGVDHSNESPSSLNTYTDIAQNMSSLTSSIGTSNSRLSKKKSILSLASSSSLMQIVRRSSRRRNSQSPDLRSKKHLRHTSSRSTLADMHESSARMMGYVMPGDDDELDFTAHRTITGTSIPGSGVHLALEDGRSHHPRTRSFVTTSTEGDSTRTMRKILLMSNRDAILAEWQTCQCCCLNPATWKRRKRRRDRKQQEEPSKIPTLGSTRSCQDSLHQFSGNAPPTTPMWIKKHHITEKVSYGAMFNFPPFEFVRFTLFSTLFLLLHIYIFFHLTSLYSRNVSDVTTYLFKST